MCGIFGYVTSAPSIKFRPLIQQGLWADTFRGMCGTGIYAADLSKKERGVFKRALEGPDFVRSRQFDQFQNGITRYQVVIGHNRASTIGEAKDENCHPFQFGDVGFVHNGTLRDYRDLVKDKDFQHSVDSAWAAKALSEAQHPTDVLTKVQGPYVFVWHNMRDQTFHITRNNNRDIWWVPSEDGTTIFFASEMGLLYWLLDRNGFNTGKNQYRNPKEHTLLTWDLTKPLARGPRVIQYEEYKPPVRTYPTSTGYSAWNHADKRRMEELELEYNEEILVEVHGWEAYSGYSNLPNMRGRLTGRAIDPTAKYHEMPVTIHSVMESDGKKFLDEKYVATAVTGISIQYIGQGKDTKEHLTISCKDPKSTKKLPAVVERVAKDAAKVSEEKDANGKVILSSGPGATKGGEADDSELFRGPQGAFITRKDFERLVVQSAGCIYCSDPILPEQSEDIEWVTWGGGDWMPLCKRCQTPNVRRQLALDDIYNTGHNH